MTRPPTADEVAAAQLGRALGLSMLSGLTAAFAALCAVGTVPWWAFPAGLFLAAWAVGCVAMFRVILPMMWAELRSLRDGQCPTCGRCAPGARRVKASRLNPGPTTKESRS